MPALDGQSISTIRDGDGNTVIAVVIFWDPATGLLREDDYTTVQDGVKHGAVIADNVTNRSITLILENATNGSARTVSVPARGRALTLAQLASLPGMSNPPKHDDVRGFTFDLSG